MNYIVYVHRNPRTNDVFYVGIGSRTDRASVKRNRNKYWTNYVKKYGDPIVEVLHRNLAKEEAVKIEIELIQKFGRKCDGGKLVNITEGGEGIVGYKHTDEAKSRISIASKRKSLEHIESTRKRMIENNPTKRDDVRQKIRISKLGKPRSEDLKRKISENTIFRDPSFIAKQSDRKRRTVGESNKRSKRIRMLTKDGVLVATYVSLAKAASETGGDFRLISAVCLKKRKSHLGHVWEYEL